jgi:stage II sporulation protein D
MKFGSSRKFDFQLLLGLGAAFFPFFHAIASVIPYHPTVSSITQSTKIRVRLNEGAAVALIRGIDLQFYQSTGPALISANNQSEWELRCQSGRVRAVRTGARAGRVGIQSVDLQEPVTVRSPAGFISFGGKPYREEFQIHSEGSLCEVVNVVNLEKYLEGLVNTEFSSKWNDEAIGAQVVAARTYALFQMRQAKLEDVHYDVDASTSDQVYDGSIHEDMNAARVVARTRGLVLTTGSGAGIIPLKAFYHSTCGGATELPEKVWGNQSAGFHRGVQCPFCAGSPASHWSLEIGSNQIEDALRRQIRNVGNLLGWPRDLKGNLSSVQVGSYDNSGRVAQVWLYFTGLARPLPISGPKFREIMGATRFKSAAFQVHSEYGLRGLTWHFTGRGSGHGVGMCQWGAKVMGERGYKTAAILHFYYPDAALRKLW